MLPEAIRRRVVNTVDPTDAVWARVELVRQRVARSLGTTTWWPERRGGERDLALVT